MNIFPVGGTPDPAMDMYALALAMVQALDKDHQSAVAMATAIREAVIVLVSASSLLTYMQDPNDPVIALGKEDLENCEPHTPQELLLSLAEGWPGMEEVWEQVVEEFTKQVEEMRFKNATRGMKKEIFVDDILAAAPKEEK